MPFLRSFCASRISSQQSSIAATHSSRSGGHSVMASVLYMDGPEVKIESRALRLALDRRDIVNGLEEHTSTHGSVTT